MAGAGEIEVRDGVLNMINRKSGHYQPEREQLFRIRDISANRGWTSAESFFGSRVLKMMTTESTHRMWRGYINQITYGADFAPR